MNPTCSSLLQKRWFILILWQICSISLCGLNTFNTLLASNNGETLPFLQLALSYTLILLVHVWRYARSDISWLKYLVVSFLSGAGDCMAIFAYNETSLSSAMLLTTTSVFWVAPITFFLLKRKIAIVQCFALLLGFAGVVLVCVADGFESSQWVGNLLSIAAAVAYAFANVLQEILVQTAPVTTFLCRLSILLAPINVVLGGAIEWKTIAEYNWEGKIVAFVVAYAVMFCAFYTAVPALLQFSSAIEMNISLLTSNFFSLAVSILAFGQKGNWLYLVGFFCVPIAIGLYTACGRRGEKEGDGKSVGLFDPMLGEGGAVPKPERAPQGNASESGG
jgi:drug/metabolite transporter (DMT)-like permease